MSSLPDTSRGTFLRARRVRLEPADVGLTHGTGRRATGLRREAVAVLAGVSAEYYARLEQGREQNPSPQVVGYLLARDGGPAAETQFLESLADGTFSPVDLLRTTAAPASP